MFILQFGCVSSASADGTLKIWTHNGIEITSFKPHEQRINCSDIWAPVQLDQDTDLWSSFDPAAKTVQQKVRAMKPQSLNDIIVYTASDDGNVVGYRPFKVCTPLKSALYLFFQSRSLFHLFDR